MDKKYSPEIKLELKEIWTGYTHCEICSKKIPYRVFAVLHKDDNSILHCTIPRNFQSIRMCDVCKQLYDTEAYHDKLREINNTINIEDFKK